MKTIALTIAEAAEQFAASPESIRRGLRVRGLETGHGAKFDLRTIFIVLSGDLKAEKTKLTAEQALLAKLEREEKEGNLVPMELARKVMAERLAPIRSRLMALPPRLAPLVNPSDPDMARKELEIAVDEVLGGTESKK